ncbi:hypothetical protein ANO11243_064000 [Dothideomycetidae sp. 11243]|nr:hypothetical protein ANO11243_064000 [fungal sp. No.11243]
MSSVKRQASSVKHQAPRPRNSEPLRVLCSRDSLQSKGSARQVRRLPLPGSAILAVRACDWPSAQPQPQPAIRKAGAATGGGRASERVGGGQWAVDG